MSEGSDSSAAGCKRKQISSFELSYNVTTLTGGVAQFNGNISEQKWKGPYAEVAAGFTYAYDKLNRLLSSVSSDKGSCSWVVNNKYDEKAITYDRNGNIKTLARYENGTAIDNLFPCHVFPPIPSLFN